jgi:hypothetical protein
MRSFHVVWELPGARRGPEGAKPDFCHMGTLGTTVRRGGRGAAGSLLAGVGVHPVRVDEDRRTALLAHHPVVGVEVLVGTARRGEYLPQQQPQALRVDAWLWVVGTDEVDAAFGRGPLPAGPDDNVGVGRWRQFASFRVPPRTTMPTTVSPVTGWRSTPAFTTDEEIVPSLRVAETTTSP